MLGLLAVAAAILASVGLTGAQNTTNISSDTFFYGQSPPVYPAPIAKGTGDWAQAYAKAAAFVAKLTLEEKNNLTYGITPENGCSGIIPPIERLGFAGMCLQDAGNGVRNTDFVSSFASGIHVGASWNKTLAYDRANAMGNEFKKKGVHIALGPVVGPLGRLATGGRDWEGTSNDPYLAGAMAGETVKGIQDAGVMTSLKHFVGNEQELYRNPGVDSENHYVESISSNIDDKTMHELYLWPFADGVHAGTANIMCSYNRLNNSHSCANSKVLNGLLKTELGFQGFVVTDWFAQHSGTAAALAGLDMAMPDGQSFWGANFTEAYLNGSVPESRLDDMATRIIAAWYKLGQDSPSYPTPGIGMPANLSEPHTIIDARDPASRSTLYEGAIEGHVLVKNENKALPLKSPKLLAVFGYDAPAPPQYMPNGNSLLTNPFTTGYESAFNQLSLAFSSTEIDWPSQLQIASNGTYSVGSGSGANSGPYLSAPLDALQQRAMKDGSVVYWDSALQPGLAGLYEAADACLVFINAFASEGMDRPGLHDDYSDNIVQTVASTCSNTIVVIHNAGVRLVDQWIDHPNVTALIFAHLPGQDSGNSLVDLLYGDAVPSGKLPYSVPKNESDFANMLRHSYAVPPYAYFPQSDFTEGVYIDYRAFDAHNVTPRYEFGFGLSYTTFSYSKLAISIVKGARTGTYPTGAIQEGGQVDLWSNIASVSAVIKNTGSVTGAEVAQLYIGIPGGPVRQLRGFEKVRIKPGQEATVSFDVTRRDLSEWDVGAQKWKLQSGVYNIYVGASSRNLPLVGTLRI